jgi:threonine synthase
MEELREKGIYKVNATMQEKLKHLIWADFSPDHETMASIAQVWQEHHYLLDTHTAVAWGVYQRYQQLSGDLTPTIIVSTASPFKFAPSVAEALLGAASLAGKNEFEILSLLSQHTGIKIPTAIKELEQKRILHQTSSSRDGMESTVLKLLGIE